MFIPSTVFNDGNLDVDVTFQPVSSEAEAKRIGNIYSNLLIDPASKTMWVLDNQEQMVEIEIQSASCSVLTKELGPPIDCSVEEGRIKAFEALKNHDPQYSITEDDMAPITLEQLIELARGRENRLGYLRFDSIAFGVVPA